MKPSFASSAIPSQDVDSGDTVSATGNLAPVFDNIDFLKRRMMMPFGYLAECFVTLRILSDLHTSKDRCNLWWMDSIC